MHGRIRSRQGPRSTMYRIVRWPISAEELTSLTLFHDVPTTSAASLNIPINLRHDQLAEQVQFIERGRDCARGVNSVGDFSG